MPGATTGELGYLSFGRPAPLFPPEGNDVPLDGLLHADLGRDPGLRHLGHGHPDSGPFPIRDPATDVAVWALRDGQAGPARRSCATPSHGGKGVLDYRPISPTASR